MMRSCCFIEENAVILLSDGYNIVDVPCGSAAEWIIVHGDAPDDYTEACTQHVGALLTDAPEHWIYQIVQASKRSLFAGQGVATKADREITTRENIPSLD